MDWWFFAEGTEDEAREFLERFLNDGAANVMSNSAPGPPTLSLASVPEVVDTIAAGGRADDASATHRGRLDWVREVVIEHGGGFRDFAETLALVRRSAPPTTWARASCRPYPVLRWKIGGGARPEVRQPVVTGFCDGRGPRGSRRRPRRCWPAAMPPLPWPVGATLSLARGLALCAQLACPAYLAFDARSSSGTTSKRWPGWVDGFSSRWFKLEGDGARPSPWARGSVWGINGSIWPVRAWPKRGRPGRNVTAYEARTPADARGRGRTSAAGRAAGAFEPVWEGVEVALRARLRRIKHRARQSRPPGTRRSAVHLPEKKKRCCC